MSYETPGEIEKEFLIQETRKWVTEEEDVTRWFEENPRYMYIRVLPGLPLLAKLRIIPEDEVIESIDKKVQVKLHDWPDYADDIDS
jgi:hypothetical protein